MKIWKLSQEVNNDYDTYDSCVVVAETIEQAKMTHPSCTYDVYTWNGNAWVAPNGQEEGNTWAAPDQVKAELIGTVVDDSTPRVILASFNAG